ncbi:MAG: purine-binding chemotaxis protein CheW [Planctomycetota bacterium]|nr:purine-binding chemotaxis protein CheW [Planctomycetota bacterium]
MKDGESNASQGIGARAGKYLSFKLGNEEYGVAILKVQEIIGIMTVTRVPRTPDCIRGVINLRGKVIPVLDLRRKFGFDTIKDTDRTCIIVVRIEQRDARVTMGVLVDDVSEVLDISPDQLEEPPSFGASVRTDFILAMGKVGAKVVMLLDIDKVLGQTELTQIKAPELAEESAA